MYSPSSTSRCRECCALAKMVKFDLSLMSTHALEFFKSLVIAESLAVPAGFPRKLTKSFSGMCCLILSPNTCDVLLTYVWSHRHVNSETTKLCMGSCRQIVLYPAREGFPCGKNHIHYHFRKLHVTSSLISAHLLLFKPIHGNRRNTLSGSCGVLSARDLATLRSVVSMTDVG